MLLYKKFHIDKDILSAIQNEVVDHIDQYLIIVDKGKTLFVPCDTNKMKQSFPALSTYLKSRNLFARWARTGFVNLPPNTALFAHIDNPYISGRKWTINIPIKNCENSHTIFYKTSQTILDKKRNNNVHGNLVQKIDFYPEEITEIDRVKTDSPYYCNVSQIHGATNPTNSNRLLLSLRFEPDIEDIVYD